MYTVSKGSSKIVAKTRRGLATNYEKFETIREIGRKSSDVSKTAEEYNVPRPVFQTSKRGMSHNKSQLDEEVLTPQHEEIVKYITESWNMVVAQNPYDSPVPAEKSSANPQNSSLYCVEPPSPVLTDFKPFDLESWWGRRLFNNITKSL